MGQYPIEMVWIWNGSTPIRQNLAAFFTQHHVPIKCLEISNLPGKLFADRQGTNAASYVYAHPEILDSYGVLDEAYDSWKAHYLAQPSQVKQAKNRHTIRYLMVLDYLGYLIGAMREDFRDPLGVVYNKFKNHKTKPYPMGNLKEKYLFFPLQVSNDTQILYHSDLDNIGAITYLQTKYPKETIWLKIHPAEENNDFIRQIEAMQNEHLVIVSNDTRALISHAQKIVTINSTVGLEAMIMGKEVEVLGRAIYQKLDPKRLKNYIGGYLLNIDYFGKNFDKDEVLRLYEH
jgi:capsular polysaccharide export protein